MNTFLRFFALLTLISTLGMSSVSAQTIYSEDFENETPSNPGNICPAVGQPYSPPDGNWAIGSACPNQTNGRPQLLTFDGNTSYRVLREYMASSEVWTSKVFSVAFLDNVIVSLDAASQGDLENSNQEKDKFTIWVALIDDQGNEVEQRIVTRRGHVDGSGSGYQQLALASFAKSVDVSNAEFMKVIFKVKISSPAPAGSSNLESYFIDNVSVCGDSNDDESCDDCDEFSFTSDLSDYAVQCIDDLPTACDTDVESNRGTVTCGLLEQRSAILGYNSNLPDGPGADWCLVLYGSNNAPGDDRFFVPMTDAVDVVRYENGTVKVSGQVVDRDNPNAILNIQTIFGQEMSGADWPGLFKAENECQISSAGDATTDDWRIYQLESGLSYLTGEGDLDGSYVQLAHMPDVNESLGVPTYGFQLGEGANNRSCGLGAGGWFYYSGQMDGETVVNGTGDFSFDLEENSSTVNQCSDGQANVTLVYTAQDLACGQVLTVEQVVSRVDDTDPTFDNAPGDTTVTCAQTIPALVTVTGSDNCPDVGFPEVTYVGETTQQSDVCSQNYQVIRQWTMVDCSGNTAAHTQTISVVDSIPPVITGGLSYEAECDGSGNADELQTWLNNNGGAFATDDCGDVTWTYNGVCTTPDARSSVPSSQLTAYEVAYPVTTTDFGGTAVSGYVVDLYVDLPTDNDVLLNVYNMSLTPSNPVGTYFQGLTAPGWAPNEQGSIFSTGASQSFDSFIAIGGVTASDADGNPLQMSGNGVAVDPNFGGNNANSPGALAGWYNGNPTNLIGQSVDLTGAGLDGIHGVFIGRFAVANATELSLAGSTFEVTWNTGVGTPGQQQSVTVGGDDTDGGGDDTDVDGDDTDVDGDDTDCGPIPVVISDECGATGMVDVEFAATDECGNTSTKTLQFKIVDTTPPTFPTAFSHTYASCETLTDPTDPTQVPLTATDFCGDVTYTIVAHTLSGGCPNTYQRIWTATDECGNVSETSEQYVELFDNTKPTLQIHCPEDYVADAAPDCTAQTDTATTGAATAEASDNCATDLEIEITYSDADTTSSCEGQFSFTRTWKATTEDDCDNTEEATCQQLITINDNTDPVIETMAMDTTAECDGSGNNDEFYAWLANNAGASATDACSDVTWTNDYATYQPADADFGGTYSPDSWTLIEQGIHAVVEFSDDGSEIYMNGPEDYGFFTGSGVVKACQPARQRLSVTFDWAYDLGTYFPNTGASFDPAFYLNDEKYDLTEPDFWGNEDQSGTMTLIVEQGDLFGWGIESYILGGFGGAELVISNFSTEVLASQDPCQDEQRIVTFTASDDCGNTSASTASFYIEDTTDPVITALMETSVACDLYDAETEYDFSASDICSGTDLEVEISDMAQSGPCAGQISRTYTVTDACGNEAEAMQVITLIDTVKPMITCPGDTTTECGSTNMSQLSAWLANVTASDNCDTEVDIDNDYGDENGLSNLCGATGSVTVTWTATDHCNNEQTCSATFTIQDTTNPEITEVASAETVECDGSGNTAALSEWLNDNGGAQATDECGDVTWTYSPDPAEISDECGATGSVTVTFTAEDECNNTSTSTATFTIEDTIDPEVTAMAMDTTAECDGSGNNDEFYAWLANNAGASATDACSDVTWTNDYATYQPADADFGGTYSPDSWTLIEQGIHAVVEFSDDGSEIYMNGPEDYGFFTGSGVVKACQPARQRLSVTFDWAYDLGTYFPNTGASFDPAFYLNDEKYDLTEPDFWGNEDQSGTMTLIVEQGDLFGWGIESYILGGFGGAELVISNFSTEVLASQDPCQDEQRIVTFTASDDCGNTGVTTTASFYIEDTTDPVITAMAETSVACDLYDAETEYDFSASDICSGTDVDVQISDVPQSGPCAGQISRTYTVTDACGNEAEAMQVITLIDTVKPMITCPGDTTTECGSTNMSQLSAWLANVTASDNCDTEVDIDNDYGDENGLSNLCGATGSVTVTWTATDHCNNEQTCSATFTIQDTTNPEITEVASAETVECDGSGNTAALSEWLNDNGGAQATDECGDVTWTYSPDPAEISDECGATGSVTVTFTAEDECNNTSTSTATFTIEDTIDPEVTAMAMDTTAECDGSGNNDEFYAWLANNAGASATDACSDVTWTNDYATYQPADADFGGTYSPDSWTLIEQGIHAVVEFSDDGSEIYMNGPEDYGFFTGSGVVKACQPARQRLSVTFDWAYDLGTYFPNTGASFDPAFYLNDEKYDLTEPDFWGNEDQSGTMTLVVEQGDLFGWGIESYILGGFGGAELVISNFSTEVLASQDPCQDEQRIVTFTASDDCGNTGVTTTASFYIEDTTDPVITAMAETSVACDLYDAETEYDFSASDICSGTDVDVQISDVPQSGPCAGKISRTYTVTDACGNEAEAMQVITLIDTVKPTFDLHCPETLISISADASCGADTTVATNGSASFSNVDDNCDTDVDMDVSHEDSQVDGCAGSYVITRVWTVKATDHCDNITSKTCTQTITVTDDTAPTIGTAASPETVECDGLGNNAQLMTWLNNNGGASATDACGDVTWSYSPDPAALSNDCGATGSVTVTFTATDECDNTSQTTATFTIEDTTDPTLTIEGPANKDLYVDASCYVDTTVATIGGITYEANDNCGTVSVVVTSVDSEISMSCEDSDDLLQGSYSFERTFTATATDECERTTEKTYTQVITVSDTISPQFTNTCGLTNAADVPVCCTDLSGTVLIPEACETSAEDNCDSQVDIVFTEVYEGEYAPQPGSGVTSYCTSSTPEAYVDGEACNGLDSHSFSLFNFDGVMRVDFTSVGTGTVAQMDNGTWVLTQELVASTGDSEGTGGLSLSVTYGEAVSWTDWYVAGQTNYKRDCGVLVDDHENWDYRIMQEGTISGTGDYSGLSLNLSHAPANEYYAMQVGLGANNQNNNYGYSGWVMASGTYNEDAVFFSGDLFGDLDCCLPWSIARDYVASDDCGNSTPFAYTINVNGDSCAPDAGPAVSGSQEGDHGPAVLGGAGDVMTGKSPIRVTNLMPNPTNDLSMLGFTVTENMRLRVDMYTMDGVLVSELYDGVASPNVNNTLNIEANDLQSGMYQIRLSSAQYLVVKKLLVTD